jgi:glutathione synthase/RimK-type ligase-like ATP-grasp enzyme
MGSWTLPENVGGFERDYAEAECRAFISGFLRLISAPWVNDSTCELAASSKMYQLVQAASAGFRIPRTLITNSPGAVMEFVEDAGREIIFKPLSGVSAVGTDFSRELYATYGERLKYDIRVRPSDARAHVVFANVLTNAHLDRIDSIEFSPAIFQDRIAKELEIRVTVVGDEIFAAEIHSQKHEHTRVDFRRMTFARPGGMPEHRVHKLPASVESMIMLLMKRFGLDFACFDLILTPDGEYVFLEVNPNGQWLWVESLTQMRITAALAAFLARAVNQSCSSPALDPSAGTGNVRRVV